MKFTLKDYQQTAVAELYAEIEDGWEAYGKRKKLTAVALSAPTSAGKTIIASALLELLYKGDETTDPRKDLTVLWITDDPSLNEQTRRKLFLSSSGITAGMLVSVTSGLDQQTFDKGTIYFMNTQQLGKGATNYNTVGDKRRYSMWDTIANTIAQRPQGFLVIVDEAHKGTKGTKNGNKTIIAQITDGSPSGTLPAVPVVLAITATPDNFIKAMTAAGNRAITHVAVDPAEVQASGLIKDKIGLNHPAETQPGDATLLEMAVEELRDYTQLWQTYANDEGEPLVNPILVVQVRAGVTDAELAKNLATLESSWSVLAGRAVAHAFQDHHTLNVKGKAVRYIAPQDIQDDRDVRVVLFKEALTTGWDCPRAEVLVSFRPAADITYIAQLVGRMVRTPLAKRIPTDDVLNTVGVYLPHFDESGVNKVVKHLQGEEGGLPPVEKNRVACPKNPAVSDAVWALVGALPTYTRPAKNHRNEVARLNALAVLLQGERIVPDAVNKARTHIVGALDLEATRLGDELDEQVADYENLDAQRVLVAMDGSGTEKQARSRQVAVRNIDDLFATSKRQLGDAAAKWYWSELCDRGEDPDDAKIRVSAIATDSSAVNNLQASAAKYIDSWRNQHNGAITQLNKTQRDGFYKIWQQSTAPTQVLLVMKDQITAPGKEPQYEHHLYKPDTTEFPAKLNEWEQAVLDAELAKGTLVAWYRNPTGGLDALGVPYTTNGEAKTMYPDFVFFHQDGDDIAVDIIDPHDPSRSDTAPKWIGLSDYAVKHTSHFRSVRAVIQDSKGQLLALDLSNTAAASALQAGKPVTSVFATYGGNY